MVERLEEQVAAEEEASVLRRAQELQLRASLRRGQEEMESAVERVGDHRRPGQ